ncbi:hypothetical protein MJO29_011037, partial [Puccinia striiformis f. sp. tritici]
RLGRSTFQNKETTPTFLSRTDTRRRLAQNKNTDNSPSQNKPRSKLTWCVMKEGQSIEISRPEDILMVLHLFTPPIQRKIQSPILGIMYIDLTIFKRGINHQDAINACVLYVSHVMQYARVSYQKDSNQRFSFVGAAFANPFFEQVCCSRTNQERDDEGKATCTKCGLNEREAIDLSDAREVETSQGARNTGYFSNAMSMPAIGVSNQPAQLAPTGSPITPTTNIIPASPITNSN